MVNNQTVKMSNANNGNLPSIKNKKQKKPQLSAVRKNAIKQDRINKQKAPKRYYIKEANRNDGVYVAKKEVLDRVFKLFQNDPEWHVRYDRHEYCPAIYLTKASIRNAQKELYKSTMLQFLHINREICATSEIYGRLARYFYNAHILCVDSLMTFMLCANQLGLHKDISRQISRNLYKNRFNDRTWIKNDLLSIKNVYIWIDWDRQFSKKNGESSQKYYDVVNSYFHVFNSMPGWIFDTPEHAEWYQLFACDFWTPNNGLRFELLIGSSDEHAKEINSKNDDIAIRYDHKRGDYTFYKPAP